MNDAIAEPATPIVEKLRRATKPRRHWLENDPPPPIKVYTVAQIEAEHPGLKGRLRQWMKRADAGEPGFHWLKLCMIRVERSVFIDDIKFRDSLHMHTAMPPAPARNAGDTRRDDEELV